MSRVLSRTIIYLVHTLLYGSTHATRTQCGSHYRVPIHACSEWGLPSRRITTTLVVFYTTVSAFLFTHYNAGESLLFCGTNPSNHFAWPLASIPPYGARTFLTQRDILCAQSSSPLRRDIVPR